ncbi:hypothetical protein [Streptomyces virginiae]|uniref:hypothetical protein n=1 Tax=Streptomyces virginiae TaxID=1961 RepID=UPI00368487A4
MGGAGWRGAAEYPLDWAAVGDRPLYEAEVDLAGPLADLGGTAPRAAGGPLGRGRGVYAEAVATGLGITRSKALMLLLTAQDG